uniref:Polyprenyl synthetase family protein n=1 Tax=candidate division WOR-3 bacterium TaxID=2052148 RepID=A0A7V5XZ27_UNCW3
MKEREEFEKFLKACLKKETKGYPKELKKGIFYALSGGKRIRPLLLFKLLKKKKLLIKRKEIMKIGLVIELIHNFSLVHDDLPAIDNDDYRRGRLTCHKVFGEGKAILIGDALFSLAFKLLSETKIEKEKKIEILKSLTKATNDLVVGEFLDITKKELTKKEYLEIVRKKTGALFRLVYEIAAILSSLPLKKRREYAYRGENYGILFQIEDDLKDKLSLPFLSELKAKWHCLKNH